MLYSAAYDDGTSDETLTRILTGTTRIALVGASARPQRPSHEVMGYLLAHGYDVTPVNPGLDGMLVHNIRAVAHLSQAQPLDMVEFFRDPNDIDKDVNDAIRLGARTIWMQIGVINEEAAARARAAGLTVVMNRCPKIEIPRLGVRRRAAG